MRLVIALGLPISALTLSVCNKECDPVISLLSKCKLPPLRTEFDRVAQSREARNITNQGFDQSISGPSTYFLESLQQARCLCSDGSQHLEDCKDCLVQNWEDNDGDVANAPISGEYNVTALYREDCKSFGYYLNTTAGQPSTTRTSPPKTTRTPNVKLSSYSPDENFCKAVLGFVEGQIDECQLLPIDAGHEPDPEYFGENGETWSGTVVLNRTAGECMCTLPVLRRLDAAALCTEGTPRFIVKEYMFDCSDFGYWVDDQPVRPPSKTTGPSPSTTSSTGSKADVGFLELWVAGALVVFCI